MINHAMVSRAVHIQNTAKELKPDLLIEESAIQYNHVFGRLYFLTVQIQNLETELVASMRRQGKTWEEVGEAMGISRQLAWQRFAIQ